MCLVSILYKVSFAEPGQQVCPRVMFQGEEGGGRKEGGGRRNSEKEGRDGEHAITSRDPWERREEVIFYILIIFLMLSSVEKTNGEEETRL